MKFAENFRSALKAQQKTQSDAAEFFDISDNTVNNWINKRAVPTVAVMEACASWLGVSLKWLLFGDNDSSDYFVEIPESNVELSAGNGRFHCETNEHGSTAAYRRDWFTKECMNPARCIRMRVKGDSMQPFLWSNDVVLINLDETRVIDGNVYALAIDDALYVKRLANIPGFGIKVISENPEYGAQTLGEEFEGRVHVIGRVRDKSGRGGLNI